MATCLFQLAVFLMANFICLCQTHYIKRIDQQDCDTYMDIVFVLDESSSISDAHFKEQIDFVKTLSKAFKLVNQKNHIGVMTFANHVKIYMNLRDSDDDAEMMNTIDDIRQQFGDTHIELALAALMTTMFSSKFARSDVPHVAILISDGDPQKVDETLYQASLAKQAGIILFTVGVGNNYNETLLQMVAYDPNHSFHVDSYDDLTVLLKHILLKMACKVTTMIPETPTPSTTLATNIERCNYLDVIFTTPDEAAVRDTNIALDFIEDVVKRLEIGSGKVQVGLTPRICNDLDGIELNKHDTKESLMADIDRRTLVSTLVSQQLRYILDEGFSFDNGNRKLAKDVAIVLVDSRIANFHHVQHLAEKIKLKGIKLITIGIGRYVDRSELSMIASSTENTLYVDTYEELFTIIKDIHHLLFKEPCVTDDTRVGSEYN